MLRSDLFGCSNANVVVNGTITYKGTKANIRVNKMVTL